jgi:hypothetical protein
VRAGCILQCYVYLKDAESRSSLALASIVISALTAGMASATVSYDYDVSPVKRKETPDFYGYIPDGGMRSVIFAVMVLNSALLLLIRSIGAAFLMLADERYFLWYLAGDTGLFFVLKIARGDFYYWIPFEGALGIFGSFLIRVVDKVVTDATGLIQFRHPYQLGGAYWTGNMFIAVASSFAALYIYFEGLKGNEGGAVISEKLAWGLMLLLSGAWAVNFGLFLLVMKKKYRKTFFSTKSGKNFSMDVFESDDDAVKCLIFTDNRNMWKKIEPEVKAWVQDGWERWEEEQPEWFDDAFRARVYDDMLPAAELRRQKLAGGGKRRSSLGDLIFGAEAAASARRASATVIPEEALVAPAEEAEQS